jgi:hypothetical protein
MKAVNRSQEKRKFPEFLFDFFWEYDPTTIDLAAHADLIMNRIMSRGTWEAMIWIEKNYSQRQIASFLRRQGRTKLPPRGLNYWAFICGVPSGTRRRWICELRKSPHAWRTVDRQDVNDICERDR